MWNVLFRWFAIPLTALACVLAWASDELKITGSRAIAIPYHSTNSSSEQVLKVNQPHGTVRVIAEPVDREKAINLKLFH
jgi:hypothetical protein